MVLFRTYLSTLDHWHTWRVGNDPAEEFARLAAWARGMPYACHDGFSIPFSKIPDRNIVYDPEWAVWYEENRLPWQA